ncbi:MAG: helix-turn-helix transcriptional regulator [Chloroflexi bacterium]|nr:helix-turn-helix transcriptional regulator [Chloroflexota bacterium]MBV9598126.1 helix-turn-helix transcriptional regulator [Chloroflexota bacterium]
MNPARDRPATAAEPAGRWSPPANLSLEAVRGLLEAAGERDRLLLRTLWASGARLSEVLVLRPRDVRRGLVLPDPMHPGRTGNLVQLTAAHADLPDALLRWARAHGLNDDEPLFFSRERGADGRRKAIDRVRAWQIVTAFMRRTAGGVPPASAQRTARVSATARRSSRAMAHRESASRSPPAQDQPTSVDDVRRMSVGPPPVRSRLVPRPRLVERLNRVLAHRVVLVSAPAGFGKTTTLVTWQAQVRDQLRVAWLSLGIGDNDPVRFWRGVLAALHEQDSAVGARALSRLQAGAPIGLVVDDLIGSLTRLARPLALVLDDYHVVEAREVHAGLAALLVQCPPAFHLIISTRSDPPLPLARLRSNGQLLELRAGDLQFSEHEAAGLLGDALGVDLSREQVAALGARTEGWAAGLHLAAISLQSQSDLQAAASEFAGSDRTVVDFFIEEVLERLPERTRVFLERTSILDRLNPGLCDAVVGEPGSLALLEALERANAFITPVDAGRRWYRYHQLFADALHYYLQREQATLVPELHRRASTWYMANALLEPALEHALVAGEWDRAADLLQRLFGSLIRRGEEMTVRRWLQIVPEEVCQQHRVLARVNATTLMMSGESARLATFLAAAEPRLELAGDHQAFGTLLSIHAQLAATCDDPDGAIVRAEAALATLPEPPSPYRALALGATVLSHLLRGDPRSAGQILEQMRAVVSLDMALVYWSYLIYTADRSRQFGDLRAAAAGYRAVVEQIGERTVFVRHQALLHWSSIALEWNQLDQATDCLERIALVQRLSGRTHRTIQPATLLQQARVSRARGDMLAAGRMLDAAEEAAREVASSRWERLVRAERAWLALLDGRLPEAEWWADALDPKGLEAYLREPEALILVRVRRARGATPSVVALLQRLLAPAERLGRTDSMIALRVQLALVRAQAGEAQSALAALGHAVTLAEPAGYVRVFVDEGEPMQALLRPLLRRGVCATYTARLLQAFDSGAQRAMPTAALLTPREREVLRLLALGLSNRAIAERLVTSEATVKSHVHHLIDKLGVASRTEVLVRARELGELEAVTPPGGAR